MPIRVHFDPSEANYLRQHGFTERTSDDQPGTYCCYVLVFSPATLAAFSRIFFVFTQFVLAAGCARDQAKQLLQATHWQFEVLYLLPHVGPLQ